MAESHVVSGLVSKRAELAGQIEHYYDLIKQLEADTAHIDAAIKLFSPDFNLNVIRAKQFRQRSSVFKHGDALVQVLDVMREANRPIASQEIAEILAGKAKAGSLDDEDKPLGYNCAAKHVNNVLRRLEKKGTVEICGNRPGYGKGSFLWRIV